MVRRAPRLALVVAALILSIAAGALAQSVDPALFSEMRWRMIGPFRGGRTVAAAGVPQQPSVFYIGVNNGGVWKSNDYGRVWTPLFDAQPTGSIGALAVAPSDPNVIYVGSGEGLQRPDLSTGDGIYKSTDAGKSWEHLGLRDSQQIAAIIVDPHDANRLFVAVLGHPYGPNPERGIFRSTDGGRSFQKVLYKDENTGGIDLAFDPSNPQTVYAALWEARQAPWENGEFRGPNSGLFKSTDGGATWRQLTRGLPAAADRTSRIGIDVSRSDPRRIYAIVDAAKLPGLYRSDDAGESWTRINTDERLWGRDGDFCEVRVDTKNADVVYVANIVTWKSVDGGKSFTSFRGAPGGDDYHRLWISPNDPNTILLASDQGAVVTVNGGQTWSSWYNQPTAQFYHVNTDNAFPYRVCGGQQESGSACVASRGDDGAITFRDWHPVGVEEYGYVVPDPLDPDLVYGGKVSRYDRRTDQTVQVGPRLLRDPNYRTIRTQPLVFSPVDGHVLYFASNTLWKTSNGGDSWTQISPDLTRKSWTAPPNVGVYAGTPTATPRQRGVIYAIAPSPLDINRIWVGTDDGLIHVTVNGGTSWTDVTPSQLRPWAKVSVMEASHFDTGEAYAAINTFRLDELHPEILRTRDGGRSWTAIVDGIPDGTIINSVREDPKKRGLLFAGSEQAVYVSFDDGDHWQSLRLNMPATSIRDLTIHGDDLVAGTHGRGFWILDDIEPLRQITRASSANAVLFAPARTMRVRWNKNSDTPMPPDEPVGQNPPDGAIIDYVLNEASGSPVTLEILDSAGNVIRRYSSRDRAVKPRDEGNVPWYWIRPPQILSAAPGMHRFLWDLHYQPPAGTRPRYGMGAIVHDTPPAPGSPWVLPGTYTVRLTANATSVTRPLTVVMDPRVKTTAAGLAQQFALAKEMYDGIVSAQNALQRVRSIRGQIRERQKSAANTALTNDLASLDRTAAAVEGEGGGNEFGPPRRVEVESLNSISASMRSLLGVLQGADVEPATQTVAAVEDRRRALAGVMERWTAFVADVGAMNAKLKSASLPAIDTKAMSNAPIGGGEAED